MSDWNTLDEVYDWLEKNTVETSQGSFVRVDNLKGLVERRKNRAVDELLAPKPKPKTFAEANKAAREDKELAAQFPDGALTREGIVQNPSASEGVKS